MKRKSEKREGICEFCAELWGSDRTEECEQSHTICICASYINQDFVYQREKTGGLIAPKALELPGRKSGNEFWDSLSEEGRARVSDKMGKMVNELDPVLFQMLALIVMGHSEAEICWEMNIEKATYDTYVDRLRGYSHPLE